MGRLHPKKGCDLLLEAYAATLANDPAWRLVFAGPDASGWQQTLQSRADALGIADRIVWTGMLRDTLKWSAFAAAEVFVLPSHQENFGIAVAESLACGVPVLISREVNIWREIEAANAGFVAPDTIEGTTSLLTRWQQLPEAERSSHATKCTPMLRSSTSTSSTAPHACWKRSIRQSQISRSAARLKSRER